MAVMKAQNAVPGDAFSADQGDTFPPETPATLFNPLIYMHLLLF
jgi:hypothetical protein